MKTLTYQEFLDTFKLTWKQGEHVAIIGPTGSGKTFVAQDIKLMRKRLVVIATKAKDETLSKYKGFKRRDTWPPEYGERLILFWKKPKSLTDFRGVQIAIYGVMADLYKYGSWTIYFDDLFFVSSTLKLKEPLRMFYTQVRSNDVSIVASIQRPFWVPVEAVSQSTYALMFPTRDEKDIKRVAEGLGLSYYDLKDEISELEKYEFLLLEHGKDPVHVQKRK